MTEGVSSNVATFAGHCGGLLSVVLIDGSIIIKASHVFFWNCFALVIMAMGL